MPDPAITLYHNEISTCSQKVRIALAEKNVAYESELLDLMTGQQHRPEYLRLNPNGVVPTLVHGDAVICESTVINEYIDDAFEGPGLRPPSPTARAEMRIWTKRLDESIQGSTVIVSFAIAFRMRLLKMSDDEREKFLSGSPNEKRRRLMQDLIENGTKSAHFAGAVSDYDALLGDVESALRDRAWLAGDDYSLADAGYTPFITRLEHLALEEWWADKPHLTDWFARVRARPSYAAAFDAWLPAQVIDGMRRIGASAWEEIRALLAH